MIKSKMAHETLYRLQRIFSIKSQDQSWLRHNRSTPINCNKVFRNIYIGDEAAAKNEAFLRWLNITHILNTCEGSDYGQVDTCAKFYKNMHVEYLGINMRDCLTYNIAQDLKIGTDFIDAAVRRDGKVFVNSKMGISRAATVVCAYLMIKHIMTVEEAMITLRKQREVRPNDSFLLQLIELEQKFISIKK